MNLEFNGKLGCWWEMAWVERQELGPARCFMRSECPGAETNWGDPDGEEGWCPKVKTIRVIMEGTKL